jgi:hypothetical protein
MSSTVVFKAIGKFCYDVPFIFYDNVGNIFNYSCIVLGFVGLFYWLNLQRKFDAAAKNDPNKLA